MFGVKQEQPQQDIEQLITQKIKQTPVKDRADLIMKYFYSALTAYNEYTLSASKFPENLELETYAEVKTDYESAIARLNDDMKYFCFLKIPENGIDSYTEVSDIMVQVFQTLASSDAITIVHYLGSCYRNKMQSLEFISKQVNIPINRVEKIMDNLDRLGIVWRVSADIAETPTIIYGYCNSTPLTCILVLAKTISRYLRFHDIYIDKFERGPFRCLSAEKSSPVPNVSLWDNNNSDSISEEE